MQSNPPTEHYFLRKSKAAPPNSNTPTTNIHDLPEELLGQIIRGLEPKDRVFSELVCRRWSRVSRDHGWRDFRLLACKQWNRTRKRVNFQERRGVELAGVVEKELKCILSRCTASVLEIDLTGIDERVCELLSSEMKKLETLKLDRICLNSPQLAKIGDRLPWLKSISLIRCFGNARAQGLDAFASLLSSCNRLESLNLNQCSNLHISIRCQVFSSLPSTLRRLDISGCTKIHHSAVDGLLATCAGNLRELRMRRVKLEGWTNQHLERLFTGLESLEKLEFWEVLSNNGRDGQGPERGRLECIGALKNLRRLELRCNESVTSEVLDRLVAGCRELESLHLLNCNDSDVSKEAVGRLAQLPKLTHLQLLRHPSIDDNTLAELAIGLAKLRELNIRGCEKVTDKGVGHLLEGCGGQLRELNVSSCPLVTGKSVEKLKALYNDSSRHGIAEGRVFMLRTENTPIGLCHYTIRACRQAD